MTSNSIGVVLIAVFFILSVVAVIVWVALRFSRKGIVKRQIKKHLLRPVSQFLENETGRISGTIELIGEPLIAPLSGRSCAYYHIQIEQKVQSGKSSNWRTILDKEIKGEFLIRDGRHCAYLSSNRVKTYFVQDKNFSSGFLNDAQPKLEAFLAQHGLSSTGFLGFNKTMRYKEGVLEQGESVVVVGTGKWKQKEDLNLTISDSRVLEITGIPEKDFVYISDDPKLVAIPNKKESY